MMVKAKWPGLSTYMTFFPCFMRKMGFLMNGPSCCLHTYFANIHFNGCAAYRLTACTLVSTSMISLKALSIILIHTILTKNCYSNGRLHMNRPWRQIKFLYLWDRFYYFINKFARPKKKFEINPPSTLLNEGAVQSQLDAAIVMGDYPPSPYQTTSPLPSDVEDHAQTLVQLLHPPNITSLNFHVDLVVSPSSCHMHHVP